MTMHQRVVAQSDAARIRAVAFSVVALATAFCARQGGSTREDAVVRVKAGSATPLAREVAVPDTSPSSAVMPLDEALARRRSVREYTAEPVSDQAIARLMWAAQGITDPEGHRTAPSAGALYPLELYAVTARGLFHYEPREGRVSRVGTADIRPALARAALSQDAVRKAPLVLVFAAVHARTAAKYGVRAERYVNLEAGHAAQNVLLEATALGLGAVPVGAFDDDALARALSLPEEERPLYLVAVGHPRR
jgi:SagB-type dehydrogenase family enzyme